MDPYHQSGGNTRREFCGLDAGSLDGTDRDRKGYRFHTD